MSESHNERMNAWTIRRDRFDKRQLPALVRELWRGRPESLRWVGQAYNIVYRFEAEGGGCYLRICHSVLHPLPKAHQVMHFLRFLADRDVPVGKPLPSVRGNYIESLPDGYYAAAQSEAPGTEMSAHLLDLSVYEAWGQSLGRLHAASRHYQPSPAIDYAFPTVQRFWRNIASTVRTAAPELQRIYAQLTEYMNGLPPNDYGLIHGDYRPGNVIWDGSTARTVDFDEPNYHWYIADVSRALLELSGQPPAQRRRFREAFMRGYQAEHPLDEFWVRQLPQFGQHRGMLMSMWNLQEGGSEISEWALRQLAW